MIVRDKRRPVEEVTLYGVVTKCERRGASVWVHLDTGYLISLEAEEWQIIASPQSA